MKRRTDRPHGSEKKRRGDKRVWDVEKKQLGGIYTHTHKKQWVEGGTSHTHTHTHTIRKTGTMDTR